MLAGCAGELRCQDTTWGRRNHQGQVGVQDRLLPWASDTQCSTHED